VQLLENFPAFYGTRRFNTETKTICKQKTKLFRDVSETPSTTQSMILRINDVMDFFSIKKYTINYCSN
jgi:hypothetical protein